MRMRGKLRALALVAAASALLLVYCYIDEPAVGGRTVRSRRFQIARLTAADISQLAGHVGPAAHLPPSPPLHSVSQFNTAILIPKKPHQTPILSPNVARVDRNTEGNLYYDAADAVPRQGTSSSGSATVLNKGGAEADKPLSQHEESRAMTQTETDIKSDAQDVETSAKSEIQNEMSPVKKSHVNAKDEADSKVPKPDAENNVSIFTKEKELIDLAQLPMIPVKKRKKLEMFLSHLSETQFNEVYRAVVGYENIPDLDNEVDTHRLPNNPKPFPSHMVGQQSFPIPHGAPSNDEPLQARRPCLNGCQAHKRLVRQERGYAARVAVESITLPPDWSSSPEVDNRLDDRRRHLKQVCQLRGLDTPTPNNSINAWEFVINPQHKLVWCNVFKAASSTWFYNFNILAGYSENRLLKTKETPIALARRKYPRPTLAELMATMNQTERPLSFMIARHPLHRLVSGYRDKMLSGQRYYSNLARRIVQEYSELGKNEPDVPPPPELISGSNTMLYSIHKKVGNSRKILVPTFPQFVQFIIDSDKNGKLLDEHWIPMYKFCSPCLFQFDVIAKVETLDEDSNYIIFKSGIQNIVKPKLINRNRNAPTDEVADSFLCQLSRPMMLDLVNMYKYDLEVFDYEYQHYINCTADYVRLEKVS